MLHYFRDVFVSLVDCSMKVVGLMVRRMEKGSSCILAGTHLAVIGVMIIERVKENIGLRIEKIMMMDQIVTKEY